MASKKLERRIHLLAIGDRILPSWPAWVLAALVVFGAVNAWQGNREAERTLKTAVAARDAVMLRLSILARRSRGRPLPPVEESREVLANMVSLAPILDLKIAREQRGRKVLLDTRVSSSSLDLVRALRFVDVLLKTVPLDQVRIHYEGNDKLSLEGELRG